jgi:branched-chain amino acid aminotransferase
MININGKLLLEQEANIDIQNRGFQYGDSVFETIRVLNSKVIFWEEHYFRLMSSMRLLRMQIPLEFSPEFLEKEITNLIHANKLEAKPAKVKINISRKTGGLYRPKHRSIDYFISCQEVGEAFYTLKEQSYEIELFKDHYVNSGLLSTLKTNNKLISILGSIYAEENSFQNCLLLNEKKSVVEFTNGNVFLVKGKTIKTPPLSDGCLKGITRHYVIDILKNLDGFTLSEESISPFELQKADEIFMTNVITGIQSVTKYRKKTYTNEIAKSLIGKLNTRARLA